MRKLALFSLAALTACGSSPEGDSRSGTGGSGGNGVTIPAHVDQMCRDYCANADEREDCGPQACDRYILGVSGCSNDTVQACYEDCLTHYGRRAEGQDFDIECPEGWKCFDWPPQCLDEWLTEMNCVLGFECNDMFGDCDSLIDAVRQCDNIAYEQDREEMNQWCFDNCPNPEQCGQRNGTCFDGGDSSSECGRSSENLVDPADPNALSEVLVIPGAVRVQGSPPQGSDDPSAPAIAGGGAIETISGDQAVLQVTYDSPSGYVDCYVQVTGADDYFVISVPSSITSGTIQIPVNIPEDVDSGTFDLYTCIAGQNGAVSNAINTNVGVTYSGGSPVGGGNVICASSDPSVGTALPCGGGTQLLDFCIDQSSGACYYEVCSQQVSCGNCGDGGDVATIQACAERAVALCL